MPQYKKSRLRDRIRCNSLKKGQCGIKEVVPVRTEYAASGKSVGTATGELAHCTAFRIIALGTVSDTIVDEIVITLTLP